jgi:hypothetical protein
VFHERKTPPCKGGSFVLGDIPWRHASTPHPGHLGLGDLDLDGRRGGRGQERQQLFVESERTMTTDSSQGGMGHRRGTVFVAMGLSRAGLGRPSLTGECSWTLLT